MKVGDLVKYKIDDWSDDDCEVFLVTDIDGEWATVLGSRGRSEVEDYIAWLEVVSEGG